MHRPAAPIFPFLDKSCLFVHLPTDPQNPNRYLQCQATRHLYCISTGSLYIAPNIPLSANNSSLLQGRDSCLLPSIPTPYAMKTVSVKAKTDQQDHGASTTLSIKSNMSHKVKDVNQPIPDNSTLITQSNIAPDDKNVDEPVQSNDAPSISDTASKVNHVGQHIQCNIPSIVSHVQCKKKPNVKKAEQPLQGIGALITPKARRKKASKSKTKTDTQAPSPTQSAKTSACLQNNSNPTTNTKMKKHSKKAKNKSVPLLENSCASPKKTYASSKKNKSTVPPQPKPTTSFINNSSSSFKNPASINQTIKQCKAIICPDYTLSPKCKRKSYTYYKFYLHHMIKEIQPFQINFEHILVPQNENLPLNLPKFSRKHETKNAELIQICSLPNSEDKWSPKYTKKEKTSLFFSREDYAIVYLENSFKKKTAKKKSFRPVPYGFKSIWAIVRPFNRRPHPHHHKKKSLLCSQGKNCIMASSVHEIIHSRFAKNTNEHMPVSQIRAMLSSGDRKLSTRSDWIKRMEEEAIHNYKKMNLDQHNQKLDVKEYELLHHKEKCWLACSNRSVMKRKDGESWPLLVKCLHKYPDSTLRQASKHRSFCLSWNGTSYTLQKDHAYYTQIQCHMAITNTLYAELVVHTHKETTFLPVHFDIDFWKQTEATLETFFTSNILPYLKKNEILSNPVNAPLVSENSNDLIEE